MQVKSTDFHTLKCVTFCSKIGSRKCNFCIFIFIHLLKNGGLPVYFKISLSFTDDTI